MFVPRLSQPVVVALIAASVVIAISGCGSGPHRTPAFKTTGKITFQNQPVEGAFLVLHPKQSAAPNDPRPTAHVKADGSFETTTYESADGAPAGEYVVTVQWQKLVKQNGDWVPGPNLLPAKYANPATSDIVIRVAEGTNNLPPIVLR